MSKKTYIGIVAVLVVLIGLFFYISRDPNSTGSTLAPRPGANEPIPYNIDPNQLTAAWQNLLYMTDAPPKGNANAPYTMIEVGDFQCPQCGKVRPLVEKFLADSDGQVKLYFLNYPLTNLHPHALFAAEAAEAAAKQGKFWPMYDLLYTHQDELIPSTVLGLAQQSIPGFDTARYEKDLASDQLKGYIRQQVRLVMSLNLISTPTFLIKATHGGTAAWFTGVVDSPTSLGLNHLSQDPPWQNNGDMPTLQS